MKAISQLGWRRRWPRLREFLKLALNEYQFAKVGILRLMGVIDFPVPPNSNMRKTGSKSIKAYVHASLTTYTPIVTIARFYGIKFDSSTKVLDFGCGVGRQLMPLTDHFP